MGSDHANKMLRFGLFPGQFFAEFRYKNLWWELDGEEIGFGDLREGDILRIQANLNDGEEFVGWNEHHHSDRGRQTNTPMIRIRQDEVKHRHDILREEGR